MDGMAGAGPRSRARGARRRTWASLPTTCCFASGCSGLRPIQWSTARGRAGQVALFGDLPFMVAVDSADVWARQDEFRLDVSVRAPAAFSEDGQDWGRRPAAGYLRRAQFRLAATSCSTQRETCSTATVLDHLVGFYRTYFRERNGAAGFTPPDEASQEVLGERVLNIFLTSGADIVVEDLGIVPDFVRASLDRLGCRAQRARWERHWSKPGQPFGILPIAPSASVATSGTHDTEPMSIWWEQASVEERSAVLGIPAVRERIGTDERTAVLERSELSNRLREALLNRCMPSRI